MVSNRVEKHCIQTWISNQSKIKKTKNISLITETVTELDLMLLRLLPFTFTQILYSKTPII